MSWFRRWRKRRRLRRSCFHHDIRGFADSSYVIVTAVVDHKKTWLCSRCGRAWSL